MLAHFQGAVLYSGVAKEFSVQNILLHIVHITQAIFGMLSIDFQKIAKKFQF